MIQTPSYAKWCERNLWTVQEAVCLMLGVEPDAPWLKDLEYDAGGPGVEALGQYSGLAARKAVNGCAERSFYAPVYLLPKPRWPSGRLAVCPEASLPSRCSPTDTVRPASQSHP